MRITAIEAHVMGIPSPGGSAPSRNWIFVKVLTDAGLWGTGEATTEYHELAVVAMIERHFAPLLVGQDPTRVHQAWQQMQRCFWWRGGVVAASAASGIEQALWDVAGKAYGVPVHKLLGGALRDEVRLYARGDLGLPTCLDEVQAARDEGFDAFKMGPGRTVAPFCEERQVDVAAAQVREVRAAVGSQCDLMLDCGGIFSRAAAHRLLAEVRDARLQFVEEPVNGDIPHELRALRDAFPQTRIAAGERCLTRWQFREWLELRAVDVIQADVSHCGGIGELLRIAAAAETYGIAMAPHNPYGPVALAASLQASLCMPNFLLLEHCRLRPWFDRVQRSGPTIVGGRVLPGDAPGLGVELDWDAVAAHPYQPRPLRTFQHADGGMPLT